jgi:hypothetical protein
MTTNLNSPEPPPPPMDYETPHNLMVDRDTEHLRILSICWYVASGLALLIGCIPLIYVILGVLFITNPAGFAGGGPPPPVTVGWFMAIFGGAATLLFWVGAILGFFAAWSLPQRRRLALCYTAAALACLQIPIGTVLGVFTFIVLTRRSIKTSFP